MLDAQHVISGAELHICFLTGDDRCTAREGMVEWINAQKNPEDAAQDLREILSYIADHGSRTPSSWFERMVGRRDIWAVRKKRLRLYGFMVAKRLYLCTHDEHKNQRRADQRLLDRAEDLRDEWDAQ